MSRNSILIIASALAVIILLVLVSVNLPRVDSNELASIEMKAQDAIQLKSSTESIDSISSADIGIETPSKDADTNRPEVSSSALSQPLGDRDSMGGSSELLDPMAPSKKPYEKSAKPNNQTTATATKTPTPSAVQKSSMPKEQTTTPQKEDTPELSVAQKYAKMSKEKSNEDRGDEESEWDENATFDEYRQHIDTTKAKGVVFPNSYTHSLTTRSDGTYDIIIARRAFSGFQRKVLELKGEVYSRKRLSGTDSMTVHARW